MILGRATTRHLRAMVMYLSTKSAMPTIHSRSKKSSVSRLGFRNMRLGEESESQDAHLGSLALRGPSTHSRSLVNITCRKSTKLGVRYLCPVPESAINLLCDLRWVS